MKIGINGGPFILSDDGKSMELIARSGFDCIDYFAEPGVVDTSGEAKTMRKLCSRYGVTISQTHLPIKPECTEEDFLSDEYVGSCISGIRRTAALGVKYAVVHPFVPRGMEMFEMGLAYDYAKYREHNFILNMRFFEKLKPVAESEGVVLCIENLYAHDWILHCHVPSACSDPHETLAYIDALGKNFGACYDTGHHNLYGGSPAEMCAVLGKHLKVLHVQSNYGQRERGLDWHMIPGVGDLDFAELLHSLHKINYEGVFSFEVTTKSDLRDLQYDYIAKAARRYIELYYN